MMGPPGVGHPIASRYAPAALSRNNERARHSRGLYWLTRSAPFSGQWVQEAMVKDTADTEQPLDPIEALIHIRTIVEASADLIYGTRAEPAMREITAILDKVLPPRRRRPPTKQ